MTSTTSELRDVIDDILTTKFMDIKQARADLDAALKQADISYEGKHYIWQSFKRFFETQREYHGSANRLGEERGRAFDMAFVTSAYPVRRVHHEESIRSLIETYYPEEEINYTKEKLND